MEEERTQVGQKPDDSNIRVKIGQILNDKYVAVSTDEFRNVVEITEQIDKDELDTFIDLALEYLSDTRNEITHDDRWEVKISKGSIFVYRTRNTTELRNALETIDEVLMAIRDEKSLPDISILVRGTEKFYDLRGLSGLSSRAWVGFDFR